MFVVTGAAGFIGSALVWELNQRGEFDIVCVDDMGSDERWKNLAKRKFLDFVHKDDLEAFLSNKEMARLVKGIFHIGACSSTSEKDVSFLMKNNYEYSAWLFQWCAEHQKAFIYASSCATYGAGEKGFDDATDPHELVPLNPYGYSKVLFDRWVTRQKKHPLQWVGLKFSNVFGPHEYHKGEQSCVAFKAYNQIKEHSQLRLFKSHRPDYKDGFQKRDFVYIKDVTRWIWEIYQKPSISGIYNMGFGEARPWMDLAEAAFDSLGKKKNIEWIDIPEHLRDHYQYYTEAKMDRLLKQGLSQPQWDLRDGVKDYFQNYLSQKDNYL